ncbi:MAG: hypothetical protein JWN83_2179 [Chitinophagaceae bacterium]|nr:hypothetical protein [Chitinophagaceae bacterium]
MITILSPIRNITKRRTAALELAESEQKYRTLFEQNLSGIYRATVKGAILNCNDAFVKMLKYDSLNELLEINAAELYFLPEDRNNFITTVIGKKKLCNYEDVLKCKDGSPLYVIENISLQKDAITGEEFFDGVLIDITDRKLAELRLKENDTVITNLNKNLKMRAQELALQNEEKEKRAAELIIANKELVFQNEQKEKKAAELIIANQELKKTGAELKKLSMVAKETINGVVIRDKDQNIVWVNNAFTKMYGYELDEVTGRNPKDFLPGPETDVEVLNYVKEQYRKKETFVFEILNYTKSGNKIYVRIQVQPIFDENGSIKQSFALHTDITRQRELEEKVEMEKIIKQKQITNAVFAAQERERSEIGRELHDNVNQILSAIRMYIDIAKMDEKNHDSLLTKASAFALSAIEEVRKLSKTLITPLIKEIGLKDTVKNLTEEIMLVHPIKILFTATDFTEEKLSDKFKLNVFRIVQEQIGNVLRHAQAKKIYVNIEDNYGKLLISISDDGIGFDTTIRKAGVGITNIKNRTELYNGSLHLNSEQGKGTALSITFNKTDLLITDYTPSCL